MALDDSDLPTLRTIQQMSDKKTICALCCLSGCLVVYIVISLAMLAGAITMIVLGHQRNATDLLIGGYFLLGVWICCCLGGCHIRRSREK